MAFALVNVFVDGTLGLVFCLVCIFIHGIGVSFFPDIFFPLLKLLTLV